ncbi:hypothetical protein JW711_04810 [Candidatus Woesearchaeota archaeon]|nr:hypothetical protein [Candidatus Woesearchaeota archaeon]
MMRERKAALELGVNFIVVMIISIILLGMGFYLVSQGANAWADYDAKMQAYHESQIRTSLAKTGQLVFVYPGTETVQRGKGALFTVGINNELGVEGKFRVVVKQPASTMDLNNKVLYFSDKISISNNQPGFTPVKITLAPDGNKESYIFNVCVYKEGQSLACPAVSSQDKENAYGDMQKIILHAR